jgi:transcriptional regulator with XRE-family HTH domain
VALAAGGQTPRRNTLGSLLLETAREGERAYRDGLQKYADPSGQAGYVVRREGGELARLHLADGEEAHIRYGDYSAPDLWAVPYVIFRTEFDPVRPGHFMFHPGEELLTPISGAVHYHYVYSPQDPPSPPALRVVDPPVTRGTLLRMNPRLPHHTWAGGDTVAAAWMVMCHPSGTHVALTKLPGSHRSKRRKPRMLKLEEALQPHLYALSAWGVADAIRARREQANIDVGALAEAVGVDASTVSKIESLTENVSLETVVRIGELLQIPLFEQYRQASWDLCVAELEAGPAGELRRQLPERAEDRLAPSLLELDAGERRPVRRAADAGWFESWIVLEGRAIAELEGADYRGMEILTEGAVLHTRGMPALTVEGIDRCRLLHVTFRQRRRA